MSEPSIPGFDEFDDDWLHAAFGQSGPREPEVLCMPLVVGGRAYTVWGGPYDDREYVGTRYTVCLKEHARQGEPGYHLPIRDFGTPPTYDEVDRALAWMFRKIVVEDKKVFVGCGWGRGRTGMILACMAKAAGQRSPVAYVRSNYRPEAVETEGQEDFVRAYPTGRIRWRLRWYRFLRVLKKAFD